LRSFATESRKLSQIKEEYSKINNELKSSKENFNKLSTEIDKLEKLSSRLKEETNDLEVKSQKYHTYRVEVEKLEARAGELGSIQTKLKKAESELTQITDEKNKLEAESNVLKKRKKTLSKAVSPDWGTVHTFSIDVIVQLDAVDEFIKASKKNNDTRCIQSLSEIHSSLVKILSDHDIEILNPSEGSLIKDQNDQIEILSGPKGTENKPVKVKSISKTGYLCKNGGKGKITVLRKAEIITVG